MNSLPVQARVAVVGAGWAGLAAAVALTEGGARVTVFESARQAGGRARRVGWNGLSVDNGQHLLVGAYHATLGLLATVGVDADAALLRLPMVVEVPGALSLRLRGLPAPLHLAVGLFSARGASWREKMSAALFMRRLQGARFRLDGDTSVTAWLDANGQRGTLREHLWDALCVAALNTRPAEASAQVFANVLRDTLGEARAATDFLLPRVDLGALFPEAASGWLVRHGAAVRNSCRVSAVRCSGAHWRVESRDAIEDFDHVVVATGARAVTALLPADARLDGLRHTLSGLAFEPIATAYLRYPPGARLPLPILALNRQPAQWLVDRGQLTTDAGLFAHVLSAHGAWEELDDAALAAALDARMREALPGLAHLPPPSAQLVIREKRATFRCTPNLLRPTTATALPSLWLAGDYVHSDYPGTLESAVRSGQAASAALLGQG